MGNTKSYPNPREEVETTMFMVDFVGWSINGFLTTVLLTVWVLYAFFNLNIIPTITKASGSESAIVTDHGSPSQQSVSSPDESDKASRTGVEIKVGSGSVSSGDHHRDPDHVDNAIMSATDKQVRPVDLQARLYITLSIMAAFTYSYFYVILHTVRYVGIVTEFGCALPALSMGVGWTSNRLFLYLYLMHRLKSSFQGTFLEMKQRQYNMLMLMYCVLNALGVVWYIGHATYVGCDSLSILISFMPLNVCDTFCAVVLLYIFIKRLRRVINMEREMYENDPKGMTDLKRLVNKFLIIQLFAISFTYFVSLVYFVYPLKCLAGIDTMVNVFCLMITTANYDLYYQRSCVWCRRCCEKSFDLKQVTTEPEPQMVIH